MPTPQQPDRNLAMELARVTESAALAASRWVGRGDKNGADGAAVHAMRTVLSTVSMDGIVVIGEGEKDEAPMLYNGEQRRQRRAAGDRRRRRPDRRHHAHRLGRGNALAVIAVSERGTMFNPGPCVYMEKIAVGPDAVGAIDITASPTQNLRWVAKAKGESVRDLTVMILDRERHDDLIAEVRATGARIKLISDGDIFGAIATAWQDAGVDVLFGIGGTPGRRHRRGRAEVHGRRDPGPAVATQRRANARAALDARLRPRPDPDDRRSGARATTASSPPPGSPTANSCKACDSTRRGRRPRRW